MWFVILKNLRVLELFIEFYNFLWCTETLFHPHQEHNVNVA